MDPFAVLSEVCRPGSRLHGIVCRHGEAVAEKALKAAEAAASGAPDRAFLFEAAVVHDIGIYFTDTRSLGCSGSHPYICHGVLGRRLLDDLGFPSHGKVCERHVGVGLSAADVRLQKLPLPERDMRPVSQEEILVCYADKFYSKNGRGDRKRTPEQVLKMLARYGPDKVDRFRKWMAMFGDG